MDGYYDYQPLLNIDRHVALSGLLSHETRAIGYRLAALTGLPVYILDRQIEHTAGQSIWALIWSEGEERYRHLEQKHLRRALRDRPFGILVLGDGALMDPDNRQRIGEQTYRVHLQLSLPDLYWRLKGSERAQRDFWHPLQAGPVERIEQLQEFFEQRSPGFAGATQDLAIRGRSNSEIVEELMACIPDLPNQKNSRYEEN